MKQELISVMLPKNEPYLAYFISVTHCSREKAIQSLERLDWNVDRALNAFFEEESKQTEKGESEPKVHLPDVIPNSSNPPTKRLIIPSISAFQRFLETFNPETNNYLENSSKMMHLAMVYARSRASNIPSDDLEHWQLHVKVDYNRLQILLDNDMCAPLVWIEHFERLLNGDLCQLFDCDHFFDITEN